MAGRTIALSMTFGIMIINGRLPAVLAAPLTSAQDTQYQSVPQQSSVPEHNNNDITRTVGKDPSDLSEAVAYAKKVISAIQNAKVMRATSVCSAQTGSLWNNKDIESLSSQAFSLSEQAVTEARSYCNSTTESITYKCDYDAHTEFWEANYAGYIQEYTAAVGKIAQRQGDAFSVCFLNIRDTTKDSGAAFSIADVGMVPVANDCSLNDLIQLGEELTRACATSEDSSSKSLCAISVNRCIAAEATDSIGSDGNNGLDSQGTLNAVSNSRTQAGITESHGNHVKVADYSALCSTQTGLLLGNEDMESISTQASALSQQAVAEAMDYCNSIQDTTTPTCYYDAWTEFWEANYAEYVQEYTAAVGNIAQRQGASFRVCFLNMRETTNTGASRTIRDYQMVPISSECTQEDNANFEDMLTQECQENMQTGSVCKVTIDRCAAAE